MYLLDVTLKGERVFDMKESNKIVDAPHFDCKIKQKDISLNDCLERFSNQEQLSEDNKWRCPTCKAEVQAYKKMSVWKLPPVLIVHLKRFQHQRGGFAGGYGYYGSSASRGKIEAKVDFPLEGLDLKDYVEGPIDPATGSIYDLYAVSEHSGGLGGGHYTAHAFNTRLQKWFAFNDSSAYLANPDDCRGASAYLLFYRRRKPGSPKPSLLAAGLPRSVKSIAGPEEGDDAAAPAGKKAETAAAAGAGAGALGGGSGGGGFGTPAYNDFDADEEMQE